MLLRDYVNAAISFEILASETDKNNKSLQRMLSAEGNPTTENFFAMLHAIQKIEGVSIEAKIHKQ